MDVARQPRLHFAGRLALIACLATIALAMHAHRVQAAGSCCPLRQQDQLWLVSDRALGCNVECEADRLHYWRYDCQRQWTRSSLQELLDAEDPQMFTTVFLHGNRVPADEAYTKGWSAYRTLVHCADERPVRFIIWSWPSDPVRGLVEDARAKANRTNHTGYYLARFLDRLHPEAPLSLWGHSFGARAVTGALHLLGGGELCGRVLDERSHPERSAAQVVLLAAAIDNTWLLPGHTHGQALSQTSNLLLINNSSDRLLKRYHVIYGRRSCAEALGYTGIARRYLGDEADKVRQLDASCLVGKRHLFALYLEAPGLMQQIRSTLLQGKFATAPAGPEIIEAAVEQPAVATTQ